MKNLQIEPRFMANDLVSQLQFLNPGSGGQLTEEIDLICKSTKFDLGSIQTTFGMARMATGNFYKLPTPICLFQVSEEEYSTKTLFLATESPLCASEWRVYVLDEIGRWTPLPAFYRVTEPGDGSIDVETLTRFFAGKLDATTEDAIIGMHEYVGAVASAIEVFSCSNVVTIEHNPSKFINEKRKAKGKVPLFSYRTLHITDEPKVTHRWNDATHAPPRLHLRRGHIRCLSDGRRIWVRSCMVGDKSQGFIHDDYVVSHSGRPAH